MLPSVFAPHHPDRIDESDEGLEAEPTSLDQSGERESPAAEVEIAEDPEDNSGTSKLSEEKEKWVIFWIKKN